MINMLKMDFYRMFRTRSMYVIWVIMATVIIMLTALAGKEYNQEDEMTSAQQEEITNMDTSAENVNIGMSVVMPTEEGNNITVFDAVYANTQAKFTALFLVIFAVIFSTADINSGYIKNIGGQVSNRWQLILSRAGVLLVFTVLSMLISVASQALGNWIFLGEFEWGNKGDFLRYIGVQVLLHYAFVIICMTIAILLKNNVFSIIIVICLCMNLMVVLYSLVDKVVAKLGFTEFHLLEYTVTGKITFLSMTPDNSACLSAVAVALLFTIIMTATASIVFEKRDI